MADSQYHHHHHEGKDGRGCFCSWNGKLEVSGPSVLERTFQLSGFNILEHDREAAFSHCDCRLPLPAIQSKASCGRTSRRQAQVQETSERNATSIEPTVAVPLGKPSQRLARRAEWRGGLCHADSEQHGCLGLCARHAWQPRPGRHGEQAREQDRRMAKRNRTAAMWTRLVLLVLVDIGPWRQTPIAKYRLRSSIGRLSYQSEPAHHSRRTI